MSATVCLICDFCQKKSAFVKNSVEKTLQNDQNIKKRSKHKKEAPRYLIVAPPKT
jgi:hypothetical protein